MTIKTGQTIYELFRFFDDNTNTPIVPITFITKVYIDGFINTGITVNIGLSDMNDGLYNFSWSSSTFGVHQMFIKNNSNNVVYISEIYNVKPDNEVDNNAIVYIGL